MQDEFLSTMHRWIEVFMRRSIRDLIQFTKEHGLSMSQINSLMHLHRRGSCAVSDIGDHLGITNAAASQMLDRMVQQDLILRTEDPDDRRVKQIALTEKGRGVVRKSIAARQKWMDELSTVLSPAEKDQVTAALAILLQKTDQFDLTNENGC